jgi:hypothetical protein
MAAKPDPSVKASEPDQVDSYMRKLKHPMTDVVEALRRVILSAHSEIGEEIKWNAPSFFFTGRIRPFNPKENKRHVIVFNLYRKDCIRLVFPSGARIGDTSGLLKGDYADGRRLASFSSMADVESKGPALQRVVRKWLTLLDRD